MKLLVRLPNWLGDLVMSGAFLRACAGAGNRLLPLGRQPVRAPVAPCLTVIDAERLVAACRSLLKRSVPRPDHSGGF